MNHINDLFDFIETKPESNDKILPQDISVDDLMKVDYQYNYTDYELTQDWKALCNARVMSGSQYKPGMKLCQHFMPNFWDIKNTKGESFSTAWNNPELMEKVRDWGLQGMDKLWLSWVRRAVYLTGGLANSSFYRPHFSKQIIFDSGKYSGTLFDPCAGWGGRMLGTLSTSWNYVACEPNVETYNNLLRMIDFLGVKDRVQLHNCPAEDFQIDYADIVLTSPPYFDLEVYTDTTNQSYNKFDTFQNWKDNWLVPLIENGLSALPADGISAWNVMNFKKYDLVDAVLETHSKHGYKLVGTLGFNSPLANIRTLKNKDVTYIFQPKENQ